MEQPVLRYVTVLALKIKIVPHEAGVIKGGLPVASQTHQFAGPSPHAEAD